MYRTGEEHPVRRARVATSLGLALLGLLVTTGPAAAACSIGATSVAFGVYDVFAGGPLDSTGNITLRCSGQDRNISISLDRGGAPTFAARQMRQGSEFLNYNLYMDAARTILWGDGTGGTQAYFNANPPNNRDVVVPVFGRIPAGQDTSAGPYTDIVTATILF